jgi:hypothetical protein
MSMKITVGLQKKLGLPDYGSLGASCRVELELPYGAVSDDLEGFQHHVREAYAACFQAVTEELARQQAPGKANNKTDNVRNGQSAVSADRPSDPRQGNGNGDNPIGGTGNARNGHGPSEKQLTYLRQLAKQVEGLGVRRLDTLTQKVFGKPVVGLSTFDASQLIDTLKAIKAGQVDLEAVLGGAEP